MPVDNRMYDRLNWWDENAWIHLLRTSLNPARFGYLIEVATQHGLDPAASAALDVGCGGGLLAEDVARAGFAVTGVDPSEPSLERAREHASAEGLDITYVEGTGEDLPVDDASFDLVYCCDVLEHVDSVPAVLAEIRRALKPSGLFVYDTINRTLASKLVAIKAFQEWESTRFVDPNLHDWDMFIKPKELDRDLRAAGLEPRGQEGFKPRANPVRLFRDMRAHRRGDISTSEFATRAVMKRSRDKSVSYLGHAVPA